MESKAKARGHCTTDHGLTILELYIQGNRSIHVMCLLMISYQVIEHSQAHVHSYALTHC